MAKFKVGDRARVVSVRNTNSEVWRVGAEVVVVKVHIGGINAFNGDVEDYTVLCKDNNLAYPAECQLEPITDTKQGLGSWQEIEDSVGWSPVKECIRDEVEVPEELCGNNDDWWPPTPENGDVDWTGYD